MPANTRFVNVSRLIGLIHRITMIKGSTKLIFKINFKILLSRQYFSESQCIRAIRRPGNVKMAPRIPHDTAIQNFTIIFEAGPLKEMERKMINNEEKKKYFNQIDLR